jgi:hypothetical protein
VAQDTHQVLEGFLRFMVVVVTAVFLVLLELAQQETLLVVPILDLEQPVVTLLVLVELHRQEPVAQVDLALLLLDILCVKSKASY